MIGNFEPTTVDDYYLVQSSNLPRIIYLEDVKTGEIKIISEVTHVRRILVAPND